jgi:hypothetical protein
MHTDGRCSAENNSVKLLIHFEYQPVTKAVFEVGPVRIPTELPATLG